MPKSFYFIVVVTQIVIATIYIWDVKCICIDLSIKFYFFILALILIKNFHNTYYQILFNVLQESRNLQMTKERLKKLVLL